MKNKLIGLLILLAMTFGLSGFASHEAEERQDRSDDQRLAIAHEILRLYANFRAIKYGDELFVEISRAGYNISRPAMGASWGETCTIKFKAIENQPEEIRPLLIFDAIRQKQKIIKEAIVKEKINASSLDNLQPHMMKLLDLSRRRLADEHLHLAITGMREYYLREIALLVDLYFHVIFPADEGPVVEKFEELFMAVAAFKLQAACRDFKEKRRHAHQLKFQVVLYLPPTISEIICGYAEENDWSVRFFIEGMNPQTHRVKPRRRGWLRSLYAYCKARPANLVK